MAWLKLHCVRAGRAAAQRTSHPHHLRICSHCTQGTKGSRLDAVRRRWSSPPGSSPAVGDQRVFPDLSGKSSKREGFRAPEGPGFSLGDWPTADARRGFVNARRGTDESFGGAWSLRQQRSEALSNHAPEAVEGPRHQRPGLEPSRLHSLVRQVLKAPG